MARIHVHVSGIVQGVGYRPFVWKLATSLGLAGWVKNSSDGVHIEAKGDPAALDRFVLTLSTQHPAAARVDTVHVDSLDDGHIAPAGSHEELRMAGGVPGSDFRIVESSAQEDLTTLVSPDIATCPDCLRELFDPENRRYHYPFINCTNCGPRFTIIDELPYDRPRTSMARFAMCPACAHEYADPADRRFHAQPDACFACGPQLTWRTAEEPGCVLRGSGLASSDDIIARAAQMLHDGGIVAVKGLGGFHLACDARNEAAVRQLRERKHRPTKPLAVMFADLNALRQVCEVSDAERAQLTSPRTPIVLLRRKDAASVPENLAIAPSVAGDLPELGAMLPYTPLQHLLLRAVGAPLVMTSGNLADEPIICDDQVAVSRLIDVADAWLGNNRPILARYDDSVVRVEGGCTQVVRRARGIAPTPVKLPNPPGIDPSGASLPCVLACGPEQKATFCLTRGEEAFVSQHLGDLENADSFDAWRRTLSKYEGLFGLAPKVLACDMHPEYLSSKWAREVADKEGLPLCEVQHHHAHIASTLAQAGVWDHVVGVALDGTGYGPDGRIWGGEVMVCDQVDFTRAAHIAYWPLPGGAAAVRKPLRNAYALLAQAGLGDSACAHNLANKMGVEGPVVLQMIARDLNCPLTSSAGRLFDAIAAILGLVDVAGYDGEPACLLEAAASHAPACTPDEVARYRLTIRHANEADGHGEQDESLVLDPGAMLANLLEDLEAGVDVHVLARRFHEGFAASVADVAAGVAHAAGLTKAALGGGVFSNRIVCELVKRSLEAARLKVYLPTSLPLNDGGISYGQAAVARARMASAILNQANEQE